MKIRTDTAIIGAGPYGLSLAAHLQADNVGFVIIGRPMDAWINHMPEGMLLKSDGFASNLYDPDGALTLDRFCHDHGIDYHDSQIPIRLEDFVNYGLAFAKRFSRELKNALVVSLTRSAAGFNLTTDEGDAVIARRVVVAAGVGPFQFAPPSLSGLDKALVSHAYDHHDLSGFANRRVAVVGAGASAIDTAGLLRDHGCDVHLICRADRLKFGSAPGARPRTVWQRIRHPSSGLGPGWRSRLSTDAPLVFHALPSALRLAIVRRHLGPFASWRMKAKIDGRVPVLKGHDVVEAAKEGDRVRLTLRTRDGSTTATTFDHVIAGTGYRVDIRRLEFIDAALRNEIACVEQTPVLSMSFESSVEGLYFTGPAAANSFGPMLRFAFGAGFASRRVAGALKTKATFGVMAHDAPGRPA
jgi:cation diffusion facilitator CzcD-associated flavoprotein CzcO